VARQLPHPHAGRPGGRQRDRDPGLAIEVQPDGAALLTGPGAACRENADGYLEGPPELVCEVASSSVSLDLHAKRRDYERAGVPEYLVLQVAEQRALWFVREPENAPAGRFVEQPAGPDGLLRSRVLPGLWLDAAALFAGDPARLDEALRLGLASPEHQAFVRSRKA
jgi:Uma2 family endonuclease